MKSGNREAVLSLVAPLLAGTVLLVTLIGLIASALHDPHPHDIPVGLVGPAPAVEQLSSRFGQAAPGAFMFTTYDSEDAARQALDSRDVDGVLIVGPAGPRLVVAGAAGDAVAGVITGALGGAFQAQGQPLQVETVHPFAAGDAHGLILFFLVVAVIVSTLVAQAVILARAAYIGGGARLLLLLVYALLAGLVGTATTAAIVGGYGARFWAVAGLTSGVALAVAAPAAAGGRLLGAPGFARAAGVDPALVMHYFGSKAGIFRAALEFPLDPAEVVPRLLEPGLDGLGERMVRFFLAVWDSPDGQPLLGVIRSAVVSEQAAQLLREFVTREV